ncbi:MAG: indole-3-glycerol phosphate synthase TrpC [Candidatus Accumulibacter sp.]|jgi:indole-3-glycerol phosphate synthase|nr:indole-3-glycerol phosphate synthase TrpC [Accumulibacter sp.]
MNAPDILRRILAVKRKEVELARAQKPLAAWRAEAEAAPPPRDFAGALREKIVAGRPAVIAEIKKASPSKGLIRADFDPPAIAAAYAAHGAAALSVLTDRQFFQGAPEFLRRAREACPLPALRKDFIIDAQQVYEARAMGADAILLIVAALDPAQLRDLEAAALALGLAVLAEVHDGAELETALRLQTPLIGINNRDLRTFEVTLQTTLALAPRVPPGRIVVAESGIHTPGDIAQLCRHGIQAFLVGEALMRQSDPGKALEALLAVED